MTRAEQNTLIIGAITRQLKDIPNVQQVISSKFSEWFREMAAAGAALVQQGQATKDAAEGGGGGDQGGGGGAPPEGALA